jgi:hypothetical protein
MERPNRFAAPVTSAILGAEFFVEVFITFESVLIT